MDNVLAALRDGAAADPHAAVLLDAASGQEISRSALIARASAWSEAIAAHYRPRAPVPILGARTADTLALIVACMLAGRPFAVLNPRLRPVQLCEVLTQAGAGTLCIDQMGATCLYRDRRQLHPIRGITLLRIAPEAWSAPSVKQAGRLQDSLASLDLARTDATPPAEPSGDPAQPGACLFTSGSTGTPKGVLIANADLHARAQAEIAAFGLRPGDRVLNLLPWSFDVGLNQVLTALVGRIALVVLESWLPVDVVQSVDRYEISGISAVPSIWRGFLGTGTPLAGPALRYATVSGGSLRPDEYTALSALLPGVALLKTYGQTETFRSTLATPADVAGAPGNVGRPFGGARVYIVDADLARVPTGETGQVIHTGLGTMLGYLGGGCETKRVPNPFRGVDGDTARFAVLTGDLGHLDAAGCLHLHGRADDMVKVHGNRVYLQEVSAHAAALAEVRASHALAVPGPDGETAIALAVVLTTAAQATVDVKALRSRLASILPSYMCPRSVAIVPDIPLTASGKPDVPALRRAFLDPSHAEQPETLG